MKETPKPNKKIRKGDKIIVIAGNERGKTGNVLSCIGDRVLVQGINLRKKHVKANQANPKGGIISIEKPLHVSNLKVCTDDEKPIKLKVRKDENGERQLCYKEGDQEIVYRSVKKSKN